LRSEDCVAAFSLAVASVLEMDMGVRWVRTPNCPLR
jgi:hypothetical protein